MFSIIISEKGGAERRESFDRNEINVGRVQGNDLMLPKGNVSKRHARLLYRDGRFIVTDLKSTNGTYVNGRKIAQATIVREGDKIYIGDFILRVEGASGATPSPSASTPAPPLAEEPAEVADESAGPQQHAATSASLPIAAFAAPQQGGVPMPALPPPLPPIPAPIAPPVAAPPIAAPPTPGSFESPSSSQQPSSAERGLRPPTPRIEPKTGDRHEVISHFPLENDPDGSVHYAVPAPPRLPSTGRVPVQQEAAPSTPPPSNPQVAAPAAIPSAPPVIATKPAPPPVASAKPPALPARPQPTQPPSEATRDSAEPRPPAPIPSRPIADPPTTGGVRPVTSQRDRELKRAASHRTALATLVERVASLTDLTALDTGVSPDDALVARINRAITEAAGSLFSGGDLDVEALVIDAKRELLELGPLTPLFFDEDITEVQVLRHDYLVVMYGRRHVPGEMGFTSEQAAARVIRRLCASAGKPLADGEVFVERRLPRGARMFAVLPPASDQGHVIVIRMPLRASLTLEDLVKSGTISRGMAGLFTQCIAARANILVTGAVGSGTTSLLGALAAAGSTEERVVVLQEDDELVLDQPHTIAILLGETAQEGARAVQAATRIRPDRLVIGAFAGPVAAEVVDAMGDGVDGVLAAARAPTLRQAVSRLTSDIAATKLGLLPEVAREWLVSAFDLVIEIARLRDGRHRVLRVAELASEGGRAVIRDIFTFTIERTAAGGAIEGSFHPTGVVPGIVEDMAARGVAVDQAIFRRSAGA